MGDTSGFSKKELKLLEKLNKEAMKIAKEQEKEEKRNSKKR